MKFTLQSWLIWTSGPKRESTCNGGFQQRKPSFKELTKGFTYVLNNLNRGLGLQEHRSCEDSVPTFLPNPPTDVQLCKQ
jgi:hypothetical protein